MIRLEISDPKGIYTMRPYSFDDSQRQKALQVMALHRNMGDIVEWTEDGQ